MAYGNIKGITIEINGDTSKLTTALKNVDSEARTVRRSLRDIQDSLKYDKSKGPELAAQRQRELARAIENTKEKLEILKKGQAEMSEEFKKTNEGSRAYDNLTREIDKTERQLKSFEAQSDKTYQKLTRIRDAATDFGKASYDVGKTLTKRVTAPLLGIGGVAGKITMDFDASMSKVKAISGASGEAFDSLREKAREMGAKTKYSATEAADAMTYMAMAGWDNKQMIEGIDGVMNLAASSGEDLALTSDIVTDALTAFGLKAEDSSHFADVLAATAAGANTNVGLMGETFKYAAPIAGALGYSVEDTAVAIGLMANAGIKGSQAGTALRGGLTRLASPTKEVYRGMELLGLSIEDVQGKPLDETLRIFRDAFSKLDGTQQAQASSLIFGKNAMSGMLAIIKASEGDYNKLTDVIRNSDGAAKGMAETMQDNLSGELQKLKSAAEELAIAFGDLLMPALRDGVKKITDLVDKLNSMPESTKKIILDIGIFAAALGPILMVVGKVATLIGTVSGALAVMKGTMVGATPAMIGLSKVFGAIQFVLSGVGKLLGLLKYGVVALKGVILAHPVAAAIVAAITILVPFIIKNWSAIKEFLIKVWNGIKEYAVIIWGALKDFFIKVWDGLTEAWSAFWDPIGQWLGEKIQAMVDVAKPIFDTLVNIFKVGWMLIQEIFKTAWELISGFFKENWKALVEIAKIIFNALKDFLASIWDGIKAKVESTWNGIKSFLDGIWNGISQAVKPIFDGIKSFISSTWEAIKTKTSATWNSLKAYLSGIWNNISQILKPIFDGIKNFISSTWQNITTTTSSMWNGIKSYLSGIWNGISQSVKPIFDGIKNFISSTWEGTKSITSAAWSYIKGAVEGPINAAKNTVSSTVEEIKSKIAGVWEGIKTTTSNAWKSVKESIAGPINEAKRIVGDAIERIKSFFNVQLQFPHIKLPHFRISGNFSLNPPSVPSFGIDWYKKGGIFTKPTIFNTPYGMKGVGEAGAEAVLPIDRLSDLMAKAMDTSQSAGGGVTITGNTFVVRKEEDIEDIARKLYRMIESKKRGVGLG